MKTTAWKIGKLTTPKASTSPRICSGIYLPFERAIRARTPAFSAILTGDVRAGVPLSPSPWPRLASPTRVVLRQPNIIRHHTKTRLTQMNI